MTHDSTIACHPLQSLHSDMAKALKAMMKAMKASRILKKKATMKAMKALTVMKKKATMKAMKALTMTEKKATMKAMKEEMKNSFKKAAMKATFINLPVLHTQIAAKHGRDVAMQATKKAAMKAMMAHEGH